MFLTVTTEDLDITLPAKNKYFETTEYYQIVFILRGKTE